MISTLLASLPLYQPEEDVIHVGTFNVADKYMHGSSMEGTGLSVSECPDAWCSIVKLGGYPWWRLERENPQFLDYYALSDEQQKALLSWGIANGYAALREMFKMAWYDEDEDDTRYMLLESRAQAEVEATEYEDATITPVMVPYATPAMNERLQFEAETLDVPDFLATFFVEDETEFDGVWWHETLDPGRGEGSAPRGVIVLSALPAWSREQTA